MAKDSYNNFNLPYNGEPEAVTTIASALQFLSRLASWEKTLITGLVLEWVSTSSIKVKKGAAYVPSVGTNSNNLVVVSADITVTSISLGNSTWGHVYLYDNAGTAAVEVVTTAPVIYFATVYQKTGDTSRRYLGSVRTDGSGNIYRFQHESDRMFYLVPANASPFRVLNGGTATTRTNVSLANAVPVTARIASVRIAETGGQGANIGNPDDSGTFIFQVDANGRSQADDIPLDSSQRMTYYGVAAGVQLFLDVHSYRFQR
jgi:hypothetical protein